MTRLTFQTVQLIVFGLGSYLVIALSIAASDGHLIYSLDDPYIHLAVAEQILAGGYGVNSGEYASPSSSVLYALMLALPLSLGAGVLSPVIVAVPAMALALWLLSGALWDSLTPAGPDGTATRLPMLGGLLLAPLLALAVNAWGLPMTGMEHALHLALGIAVLLGLARAAAGGQVPPWLAAAIVGCALIRFEGYALALLAIVALVWLHRFRTALIAGAALTMLTATYAVMMLRLGLPPLPSSVLVKSSAAAAAVDGETFRLLQIVLSGLAGSMSHPAGLFLALAGIIALSVLAAGAAPSERRVPILVGVGAIAAHLVLGRYGWHFRYEVYAVGLALTVLALALPATLGAIRAGSHRLLLVGATLAAIGAPYLWAALITPAAARNIYEQQYQMHRFATEFLPVPVAVNDLGYVAYANPNYVLDLWGLGSETARRLVQRDGLRPDTLTRLVADNDVAYAMIYEEWFPAAIPEGWCKIAELRTSLVTTARDRVAFFLIDRSAEARMRTALVAFGPSLPQGAALQVLPCD